MLSLEPRSMVDMEALLDRAATEIPVNILLKHICSKLVANAKDPNAKPTRPIGCTKKGFRPYLSTKNAAGTLATILVMAKEATYKPNCDFESASFSARNGITGVRMPKVVPVMKTEKAIGYTR